MKKQLLIMCTFIATSAQASVVSSTSDLLVSIQDGNPRNVELSINAGADINARAGALKNTPLMQAMSKFVDDYHACKKARRNRRYISAAGIVAGIAMYCMEEVDIYRFGTINLQLGALGVGGLTVLYTIGSWWRNKDKAKSKERLDVVKIVLNHNPDLSSVNVEEITALQMAQDYLLASYQDDYLVKSLKEIIELINAPCVIETHEQLPEIRISATPMPMVPEPLAERKIC